MSDKSTEMNEPCENNDDTPQSEVEKAHLVFTTATGTQLQSTKDTERKKKK
jgi:hypothetical protein